MAYKLLIEKYGKITKAEIEVTPLTLFVGDNNSGKSYLLSLLWAFFSGEINYIIYKDMKSLLQTNYSQLYQNVLRVVGVRDYEAWIDNVVINEEEIVNVINDLLNKNKDELVKNIYNYEGMSIGQLKIESDQKRIFTLSRNQESVDLAGVNLTVDNSKMRFHFQNDRDIYETITLHILQKIIGLILQNNFINSSYYLPAARTGFVLAKNTINHVGRKKTFDFVFEETDISEGGELTPFPKPIIHFLDAIDSLDYKKENMQYSKLVSWVVENMSHGDVECIDDNGGNFQYIPSGEEGGIPLRVTSGVVTELTPLMLFLKYGRRINYICYEEPEMCLHPQLQLNMARLLVHMVNSGINIIATTHSDIIIQHINNMCQLSAIEHGKDVLESVNLEDIDLIRTEDVSIYQFEDNGRNTIVKRIMPKNNSFEVNSFINALQKILEQSINISDFIDSKED